METVKSSEDFGKGSGFGQGYSGLGTVGGLWRQDLTGRKSLS